MKKIIYNLKKNTKTFWLTEQEFEEAFSNLANGYNYWIPRLEAALSPYYALIETPSDELGYEIFYSYNKDTGGWAKIYKSKEDEEFYIEINDHFTGQNVKRKHRLLDEEKQNLVSQDDYYQNNFKKLK